ncbi:hypothetical protein NE619_13745 [Anaerovorax odorimutans]|uniref:Uncharacterized protein n=1 Tax=Anaerovorax odorimutans TaxID=109327 RepID=A0ABT1RRJ6_9FIRM|nr:hypothetical protein [Anaerovorax odorimutans]
MGQIARAGQYSIKIGKAGAKVKKGAKASKVKKAGAVTKKHMFPRKGKDIKKSVWRI